MAQLSEKRAVRSERSACGRTIINKEILYVSKAD